ncbi:lmo0937 family membrane protein [Halobacillus shinanisalinarum]|uniref:Lmo0937 family membrane protein n=1 Tax=Halobacillus shinanisalinarum TaxID=2932258 RepID=A0ABY4H5S6_9BACI|nr:lmo0937 family membrane protein [Halobacillus shinanisalinarum]UOQ94937.1 lmo0937 family membrane protein [Halobacillus shinanisalinarum]
MLWTILIILLALWLFGVIIDIAGGLIHLLLVVALVVFLIRIFRKRGRH